MKKLFWLMLFAARVFSQTAPLYVGEKTYLHTDRSQYMAGDTLWLKAYLLNAQTMEFSTLSQVLYMALLDANKKPVVRQTLLLKNAQSAAAITLPTTLSAGSYQLVSYTNFMRNEPEDFFFRQSITIFDRASLNQTAKQNTAIAADWSVQFFAEGGQLLQNVAGRVAFKVIDQNGHAVEATGVVKDEADETILDFRTAYLGMGVFTLKPVEGHIYRAIVTHQGQSKTVALPNILKNGFALFADNVVQKKGILMQVSSPNNSQQKLFLTAQMHGQMLFEQTFEQNQVPQKFILTNAKIPQDGIVQITLFDSLRHPVCERLVFVRQHKVLKINIKSAKINYEAHQKIDVDIEATDFEGKPVATNLSLSVTDDRQVGGNAEQPNFYSYLLLNSDLKGYVEKPNAYFEMDSTKSRFYLDYLMLTQGWRRFVLKELSQKKRNFEVERSLILVGKAYKRETTFANKDIWLNVWDKLKMQVVIAKTDSTGYFEVPNTWADSVKILATDSKGHDLRLVIQNEEMDYGKIPNEAIKPIDNQGFDKLIENSLTIQDLKLQDGIFLSEVTIKEKRDVLKNDRRRMMYNGEPDISIEITPDVASGSNSVAQMLENRLVGIRPGSLSANISPSSSSKASLNSGSLNTILASGVLVLIDGAPGDLTMLLPTDIDRVDMLRDVGKTTIYGISAGNGKVVNILTKRGVRDSRSTIVNRPRSSWVGYALEREFYSPKYDQAIVPTRPDYRPTLYWNANIVTNKDGKATVTFYNSDIAKKLNIVVEGTDGLGNVGSGSFVVH
jgi:hypothetical protein